MRRPIAVALFFSFLSMLAATTSAQNGSMRVTVPSPTAASLGKFGDIPVSLYTGVPDISIALFTMKGRTLELPIVLRYNPGGIRVEEIGGWAGLGWTLEAGGTITRTVRGLVDESPTGYFYTGNTFWSPGNWPSPPTTLLRQIANGYVDGDPDQFFFSFAGRSGQFVLGPTSTSSTVEYRAVPHQKLQIVPAPGLTSWVITTEDGTRYTFGAAETTTDETHATPPPGDLASHDGESHISSWHLTGIHAPGGDSITFYYSTYFVDHLMGSYRELFSNVVTFPPPPEPACVPNQFDVVNEYYITAQRLDSIKSAAHTVGFTASLRTDALAPGSGAQQEYRLDRMTVKTPTGTVLREFILDHTYFDGNRLRLDAVREVSRTGESLPPYTFTYDGQTLPPLTSYSLDHWGFYNGVSNTTPIPTVVGPNGFLMPGADRRPFAGPMRMASLTRITYPTGGFNEFVYEPNDYARVDGQGVPPEPGPDESAFVESRWGQGPVSQPFTIGGTQTVWVHVVIEQTPDDCAGQEWPPCPTSGIAGVAQWLEGGEHDMQLAPGNYTLQASDEWNPDGRVNITLTWPGAPIPSPSGVMQKRTAGGLRIAQISTDDGMGHASITKYLYRLESDTTVSSGVVTHEPTYTSSFNSPTCSYFSRSSMSKLPLGDGPIVGYSEVTVRHGANGEFGSTRHAFRSAADEGDPVPTFWPFARWTTFAFKRGQEIETVERNAAGQSQQRTNATFAFREEDAEPITTRRFRGISVKAAWGGCETCDPQIVFGSFEVISAWSYTTSDANVVYDETGANSFASVRTYTYGNPNHLQLTEVAETNSDGTQRITRMKYPADYATGSGNAEAVALTAMQGTANMHSPAIERWVIKRAGGIDSVVQAEVTSFKTFGAGQYLPYQHFVLNSPTGVINFVPSTVSGTFSKDGRYLHQETANTYDGYGRIAQLTDARNQVTNYEYLGGPNNAFLSRVTRVHDASGPINLVTDIAYDTDGFVSSIKDEGGSFRYFTYDLYGRLRQIKNHAGLVTKAYGYTYSRTSPNWTFNPSTPNAVSDTTFLQQAPLTTVVSTGYLDGLGRPIQTVVRDGTNYHVTATQYDLMGRVWRVWKPYRRPTAGYDPNSATTATDSANLYHSTSLAKPYVETAYTADALSRAKQVTPEYIGTTPTAFVVHAYGLDVPAKHRYTEITDEAGKKTRSYADIFGNAMRSILGYGAPEATTTLFTYNVLGQRTRATDPRGLVTTYAFDTRGLLTARTSPDAGTINSKYDKAGNVRFAQDANQAAAGKVFFTNYDFAGRPRVSGLGIATFTALNADVSEAFEATEANWLVVRAYDAKPTTGLPWNRFTTHITPLTLTNVSGRLAAVGSFSNDAWQVTLFTYDADGQVKARYSFTEANGGASVLTAVNVADTLLRDLRGALTERRVSVGANRFFHWYEYDNRGLLNRLFDSTLFVKPPVPSVTDTYRPSGLPQDYQFKGGPLVPIRYTIREQTDRIGDPSLTTYPFSARYTYNPNGTIGETEFYSAGSPAAAKRYRYWFGTTNYDALNRLKGGDFTEWSGGTWTVTSKHDFGAITYDAAGNLLSLFRRNDVGGVVDNLTYTIASSSNRLTQVGDAVDGSPETWDAEDGVFTYDPNGNVWTATGGPYSITTPITYNHQNLPVSITRSGTTTNYRYDDAGQRITKQSTGGNTEVYLRDGATTLGVFTVNGAGSPTSWHFNLVWENRVVGRQPNTGNRRFYHFDHLGSTRAVVDGATVLESYDFEPWGLLMPGRTLAGPTKEGFTSKERDAETAFDYFGARYYVPALGRWAAVDPLADKTPEWSAYSYAFDGPTALTDPDGRQAVDPIMAMGVGLGVVKTLGGAITGTVHAVTHPMQAAEGFALLMGVGEGAMFERNMLLRAAINERVDKLQSGDPLSQGEVIGEGIATAGLLFGPTLLSKLGAGSKLSQATDLFADAAQGMRPRPGAVAGLESADGQIVTATSGRLGRQGGLNPTVQGALDQAPPSAFGGTCAEVNCLSNALNAGVNPRGGSMSVLKVRAPGNPAHGAPIAPCPTCKKVLDLFDVRIQQD